MQRAHVDVAFVSPSIVSAAVRHQTTVLDRRPHFRARRRRSRTHVTFCRASEADDGSLIEHQFSVDHEPKQVDVERDEDVMLYDELQSDNEYVVLDGKDIDMLVRELQEKGLDDIGSSSDGVYDTWMRAAEAVDDAKKKNIGDATSKPVVNDVVVDPLDTPAVRTEKPAVPARTSPDDKLTRPFGGNVGDPVMDYFTEENVAFMPSWARAAFLKGTHREMEDNSRRMSKTVGAKRLDAMVQADREAGGRDARSDPGGAADPVTVASDDGAGEELEAGSFGKTVLDQDNLEENEASTSDVDDAKDGDDMWSGEGIYDCCVSDVADDYSVPVELIIDILDTYGVVRPISPADGIRDKLSMDEIRLMLELLTSFDSIDLSERYSDHTVAELADHYDLDMSLLLAICEEEGIYLALDSATRLQLTREDRVLDIARGTASLGGHEYPSLLAGLVVENK